MAYKKNPGVYLITNTVTKHVYVGSSNAMQRRWHEHKSALSRCIHGNSYLQHAWNKYGAEAFEFTVLQPCELEDLAKAEGYWIGHYNSLNRDTGYNITDVERRALSEETKAKISLAHKGKKLSLETRKKLSEINKGISRPMPEEAKIRISESRMGMVFSDEHKANLSKAHQGKKYSDAQKAAHVGRHNNKLTYEQACEIRETYRKGGITQKELATLYGVSGRSIFDIIHNNYHAERGMTE